MIRLSYSPPCRKSCQTTCERAYLTALNKQPLLFSLGWSLFISTTQKQISKISGYLLHRAPTQGVKSCRWKCKLTSNSTTCPVGMKTQIASSNNGLQRSLSLATVRASSRLLTIHERLMKKDAAGWLPGLPITHTVPESALPLRPLHGLQFPFKYTSAWAVWCVCEA